MPEADTLDRVKSRKVQVASLPPADSGHGFARLPDKVMSELGLNEGDVIEIVGKRSTAARAIRPYGEDEGIDIIRLDGLQRANAGVGSADYVEVRKAESKVATKVVFAPAQPNVRLQGSWSKATPLPRPATSALTPTCRTTFGRCSTRPPSRFRS